MSLEDSSGYSPVIEKPSDKAEIKIFLVDPTGQRPPLRWSSDLGGAVEHRETMVARIRRILGRWFRS